MAHNIQAMMTHQAGDSKGDEGEGDEDGGFAQLCGDGRASGELGGRRRQERQLEQHAYKCVRRFQYLSALHVNDIDKYVVVRLAP